MASIEDGGQHVLGLLVQARELLGVRARDPCGGVPETIAAGILADGSEDLRDGALNARQVELRAHQDQPGQAVPGSGGEPYGRPKSGVSGAPSVPRPYDWDWPLPVPGSSLLAAAIRASSLGVWTGGRSEGRRLP